ncbi:MAG: enoyl-CoA hydratase [Leucobacter sp.]|nr:enoyl-CoA hydratase [Leucobacter sp.]
MSPVRYETGGGVATITLDNPENRNAITPELVDGIADGLERAAADSAVRAIVLTHTGNTFCAGADLTAQGTGGETLSPAEQQRARGQQAAALNRAMLEHPKPIIAALHGHVRAGGMGLVACCDFAVAGPKATFGLSEVRIGVVAAMIAPAVLARLGDRTAADWMLRGGAVTPHEAAAAGFISTAIEPEAAKAADPASPERPQAPADAARQAVDEAVRAILADLRKSAPAALAASKALVNRRVLDRLDRDLEEMLDLSAKFFLGEDAAAGMQAFLAKQPAPWVISE